MTSYCEILRIADANFNRLGEGLRFLEEVTRFVLNDATLTFELKQLRHNLSPRGISLKAELLSARESEADVGAGSAISDHPSGRTIVEAAVANARRAEESLRVLEELSKTPGIIMTDAAVYQNARFKLYTLEKHIISRLMRYDKSQHITGLHAIIDMDSLVNITPQEATRQVLSGGARVLQLRDKKSSRTELLTVAQDLKEICTEDNAIFIINDHLDIAMACNADGLHLGQMDMPLAVARRLLPVDKIIGCSVENVAQALRAESEGADYIACEAVFTTSTKKECRVVGCGMISDIKKRVRLPLVAIGGINCDNLDEVLHSGADSVAMISAILSAGSIQNATMEAVKRIGRYHESNVR